MNQELKQYGLLLLRTSAKPVVYLDLEIQSDLIKLNKAELFLSAHPDYLVVIDEVQYKKNSFRFCAG